jgi:hypothetical protein
LRPFDRAQDMLCGKIFFSEFEFYRASTLSSQRPRIAPAPVLLGSIMKFVGQTQFKIFSRQGAKSQS